MNLVPSLVPILRVSDIRRSIAFYEILGFSERSTEGERKPYWADMYASGDTSAAALMLACELGDIEPGRTVLYYSVTDVRALRGRLIDSGISVSALTYPDHMPDGQFRVSDPDGHVVFIVQPEC